MAQLALHLRHRLRYDPENFLIHSGVQSLETLTTQPLPSHLIFITGQKRSGKSHGSFYLVKHFTESGVEAEHLSFNATASSDSTSVFIIDDAQDWLKKNESGAFVSRAEQAKRMQGAIILLSSLAPHDVAALVDNHIGSRIRAAVSLNLAHPEMEEMPKLLKAVAKQYGILVPQRGATAVAKQLERTMEALEAYVQRLSTLANMSAEKVSERMMKEAL